MRAEFHPGRAPVDAEILVRADGSVRHVRVAGGDRLARCIAAQTTFTFPASASATSYRLSFAIGARSSEDAMCSARTMEPRPTDVIVASVQVIDGPIAIPALQDALRERPGILRRCTDAVAGWDLTAMRATVVLTLDTTGVVREVVVDDDAPAMLRLCFRVVLRALRVAPIAAMSHARIEFHFARRP